MAHGMIDEVMRACIDDCHDCKSACMETVNHCLTQGGKHADADHIRTMLDCAEACDLAANFMLRDSEMHERVCGMCAELCDRCAESCERIDPNDETMRRCIDSCRHCAESCREMAGAGPQRKVA